MRSVSARSGWATATVPKSWSWTPTRPPRRVTRAISATTRTPASLPRLAQDQTARVDADDAPARARERGEVADDHPGAAAHLEDLVARPDGNEAQEPAAKALLRRRRAPELEALGQLWSVGLGVDVTPRVGVERGRRHALDVSGPRRGGHTLRCRSGASHRPRGDSAPASS